MNIREKAICECYTGYVFCVGCEREEIYKYLSEKANRTVYTHEMFYVIKEHKEEIKRDFTDLCIGKYAKSERVALPSEHDLQGKILSEQMVREILEEVAELRKQNKQLINAAFNICEEYKECEGCPLHDAKEYKCKLLDSYPEPKEAIHEYIQRIYRR